MNLQQLFEHLQEHKVCRIELADQGAAESLRVMLTKKWSKYKTDLSDLGFLDDKARVLSISMEVGAVKADNASQEFVFHLRPRSRSQIEYKILKDNPGDRNG